MKFALDVRGRQWLRVEWQGGLFLRRDEMRIFHGQILLGSIPSDYDLKQGQEFVLQDGSVIQVRLARSGLQVLRDGQDLIYIQRLRDDFQFGLILLLLVGVLDGLAGLACLLGITRWEASRAAAPWLFVFGVLFLGLTWWGSHWVQKAFFFAIGLAILQALLFASYFFRADLLVIAASIFPIFDIVAACSRAAKSVSRAERGT